jgi:hypothetical protein
MIYIPNVWLKPRPKWLFLPTWREYIWRVTVDWQHMIESIYLLQATIFSALVLLLLLRCCILRYNSEHKVFAKAVHRCCSLWRVLVAWGVTFQELSLTYPTYDALDKILLTTCLMYRAHHQRHRWHVRVWTYASSTHVRTARTGCAGVLASVNSVNVIIVKYLDKNGQKHWKYHGFLCNFLVIHGTTSMAYFNVQDIH